MKEIVIDGVTYEYTLKEKEQFTYPMMMRRIKSGGIIEFYSKNKGMYLSSDVFYNVGEIYTNIISHTDNIWKPYNPVCDHKLDGYYVKASIEALCTLKILGYKVHTKEVPDYEYFGIVNGEIQGHDGTNIGLPMTFKDGKFITEPENPKFKVGDYVKCNDLVGQVIKTEETQFNINWGDGRSSWKTEEFLELWTIEEANPESYIFCWDDGDDARVLTKADRYTSEDWDNFAPDINNEAERLGLK